MEAGEPRYATREYEDATCQNRKQTAVYLEESRRKSRIADRAGGSPREANGFFAYEAGRVGHGSDHAGTHWQGALDHLHVGTYNGKGNAS